MQQNYIIRHSLRVSFLLCKEECLIGRTIKNIAGETIGSLTVLERIIDTEKDRKKKTTHWLCKCICGKEDVYSRDTLLKRVSFNCTCYNNGVDQKGRITATHLIGKKFGRLQVLDRDGLSNSGKALWKCLCECGNATTVDTQSITNGTVKSCGCYKKEILSLKSGENSSNWNGGVTPLNDYFRNHLRRWKMDSLKASNFKCVISNSNKNLVIHHYFITFNEIRNLMFKETDLPIKSSIKEYTPNELDTMLNTMEQIHYRYGLGVVLNNELHIEFHKTYGYSNSNFRDFHIFYKNKTKRDFDPSFLFEQNVKILL